MLLACVEGGSSERVKLYQEKHYYLLHFIVQEETILDTKGGLLKELLEPLPGQKPSSHLRNQHWPVSKSPWHEG